MTSLAGLGIDLTALGLYASWAFDGLGVVVAAGLVVAAVRPCCWRVRV